MARMEKDTVLADLYMTETELEQKYQQLRNAWQNKSAMLSSTQAMMKLPEFTEVVNLGPEIIPLIARELANDHSFLFLLLYGLTTERPVRETPPGNVPALNDSWIKWCIINGYLSQE